MRVPSALRSDPIATLHHRRLHPAPVSWPRPALYTSPFRLLRHGLCALPYCILRVHRVLHDLHVTTSSPPCTRPRPSSTPVAAPYAGAPPPFRQWATRIRNRRLVALSRTACLQYPLRRLGRAWWRRWRCCVRASRLRWEGSRQGAPRTSGCAKTGEVGQ